ncbi:MAG: hypothetical protein EA385_12885 [Salinarimonadaceae bacterium]|nr:MAG: hypothetical protein EA385_12885 [Salinarimonadaceae bacterium]
MNNLSWILYVADAVPRAGVLVGFVSVALGVGAFALLILGGLLRGQRDQGLQVAGKHLHRKVPPLLGAAVIFAFAATLTPSRSTILMIAASEVGETVASSPEAREMMTEVQSAIRAQIRRLAEE